MTINFNNIFDAYAMGNYALWKIYAQNNVLLWEKSVDPILGEYLTFDILSSGEIIWKTTSRNAGWAKTISYSKNNGAWTSITSSYDGVSISVSQGDIIRFKGNNESYGGTWYSYFNATATFNVRGNIMSLIYEDNFATKNTLSGSYNFFGFFEECTTLISAENLILPATTLRTSCYEIMFKGCVNLTTAPALPATSFVYGGYIASSVYSGMFQNCTKLKHAPALPSTQLTDYCYWGMFDGCSRLISAPELLATTLASACYQYMFRNCQYISSIKCLTTNHLVGNATTDWLYGTSPSGTFTKRAGVYWNSGTSGIPNGWTVQEYYPQDYLKFDILSDGNITWKLSNASGTAKTISYRKNGGEWTSITSSTTGVNIAVVTGDKVEFKGNNSTYATSVSYYNSFNGSTASFNVSGNIMSLISGDNFDILTTLTDSYSFTYLFYNCNIVSAEHLILPATTLADRCYYYMFRGCSSLTTAPALPATTLAQTCYTRMFMGCTALTTAPELPATTLANNCYESMFRDCSSLTTAPELPATTLADYCYYYMFRNCTSLTTAPELPATTLAIYCYARMLSGCTALTTAPELPATTLVNYCYQAMFDGSTALNYVKCLATDISASNCTSNWLNTVSSTGTFIKKAGVTWGSGKNGIPSRWTVVEQ